jgi:hypothetical protein
MDVFEPKLTPRVIVAGRMKKEAPKKKPLLGYRGAFPKYLFLVYIPLLVIPWVFTCILSTRPLTGSSYYEPSGKYSSKDIAKFSAVWQAVRVLTSLTSLLTIPIISGVLAQAAVIYTQRRKAKQELSLRQLFAIADRGWSNISIIFRSIKFSDQPHKRTGFGSTFLYMGAGLLLLGTTPVLTNLKNSCRPSTTNIDLSFCPTTFATTPRLDHGRPSADLY